MKKSLTLFFLFSISLAWFSCVSPVGIDPDIYGQWHKSSWTIDKTGEAMNVKMDFLFKEDGSYLIDYGSQTEKGVFSIDREKLYTTEDGQAEKFVEITKLTPDTLQFKMNRAGRMETVVLVKK